MGERRYKSMKKSIVRPIGASDDECWEWSGDRCPKGYGRIGKKRLRVHRVSYERYVGPIPDGMMIIHSCDNPPCFNPKHLRTGTAQDNSDDRQERGRHRYVSGSAHPTSKLNEAIVAEIYLSAKSATALARQLGVSPRTISCVRRGESWRHVTGKFRATATR